MIQALVGEVNSRTGLLTFSPQAWCDTREARMLATGSSEAGDATTVTIWKRSRLQVADSLNTIGAAENFIEDEHHTDVLQEGMPSPSPIWLTTHLTHIV